MGQPLPAPYLHKKRTGQALSGTATLVGGDACAVLRVHATFARRCPCGRFRLSMEERDYGAGETHGHDMFAAVCHQYLAREVLTTVIPKDNGPLILPLRGKSERVQDEGLPLIDHRKDATNRRRGAFM